MLLRKKLLLSAKEKRTFKIHTTYMFIEGIINGALLLNEFILIKSLLASNFQVSFLFEFSVVALLFSVLFNEIIKRIRRKKKFLLWLAIITRLPLISIAFFPKSHEVIASSSLYPIIFLVIFLFYYLYKPAILPTINLMLRNSYSSVNFGRLYSYSTSINKIVMLFVTFGFGLLLDINNYAFTYVFPILSVLGIFSIYLLTFIEYTVPAIEIKRSFLESLKQIYSRMADIVLKNKPFRDFEIGFMFYGFAWMGTAAVITIFLERELHLNYFSVSFYKNSYNLLAILFLPSFGKLIGIIDPRKFGVFTFTTMLLHLLFMLFTSYSTYNFEFAGISFYPMLIVSYIFYGLFASTMPLLWGIGSSYFCKNKDAADYQSVHLSLVGFRSIFAPVIGILFLEKFGFNATFIISIFLLLMAIFIMLYSRKKYSL